MWIDQSSKCLIEYFLHVSSLLQHIETDESAKRPEAEEVSSDALTVCQQQLEKRVAQGETPAR